MNRFFDPTEPILSPAALVQTITRKSPGDLALPGRAVITFSPGDLTHLVRLSESSPVRSWLPFRHLFLTRTGKTVLMRCEFGGPNIAAAVEELSAFGVSEFIVCGYCGSLGPALAVGDVVIVEGAVREEGLSYHYLPDSDDSVGTDWLSQWDSLSSAWHFKRSLVWTCDALYRETAEKVKRYRDRGIGAVEMEVASLYAVALSKGLKAIAFLVVSDHFESERWFAGFHLPAMKKGIGILRNFIAKEALL